MLTPQALATFLPISLLIAVVPGPSWLLVINATAERGRRGGMTAIAGNSAGILTHTAAAAAGLSAVLYLMPPVLISIQVLGAAYLVYLGIRALRNAGPPTADRDPARTRTFSRIARDGFVVNLLNPKMLLLMFSLLPQFIDPDRGWTWAQILVLGALHTCS